MFDLKNIKRYYRFGFRRIRNFLLSSKSREFLVFLFFVLVSFAFWLLQTLDDVYQTEFKVPLRLKNVPKEVVITSDLPEEVRVQVEDRGTVLLNYMLGRTFFPVTFDFSDYMEPVLTYVFLRRNYRKEYPPSLMFLLNCFLFVRIHSILFIRKVKPESYQFVFGERLLLGDNIIFLISAFILIRLLLMRQMECLIR